MNTKEKNIYDDNVLQIVVQETPKTRTLDKVETALSLIDASVKAITDDISTLNTKTDDISTRLSEFISDSSSASRQDIEDVSTRVTTLAAEISDVSIRLSSHIDDYESIDADVSALKTLTAAQTTRLNGHDTSITSLSDGLGSANASISGLRNDVSATNNLIVVYDTSLRSDVSTLESNLTAHLNDYDTSVRNHFVNLDASVSYLQVERNRLDASISSLTSYIDTTVTDILMTDRARINSIESLVIDTSVYVHDTLSAYDIRLDTSLSQAYTHIDTSLNQINSRLDSSLNQFNSRLDSSLNQINNSQQSLISNWDERDVVIARALAQHDASILNLIARVTALENA